MNMDIKDQLKDIPIDHVGAGAERFIHFKLKRAVQIP
jgi:hypothetical protein